MPRRVLPLNSTLIRTAMPGAADRKLFDGDGLYLLITSQGSKGWRFKYRIHGRERGLSFGTYPEVSLNDARVKRQEARALLAQGSDPSLQRQSIKAAQGATFGTVAREWLEQQTRIPEGRKRAPLSPSTAEKTTWMLESFLLPKLGSRPIRTITPVELLIELRRPERRGVIETAHRSRSIAGRIWRYAVATGRADRDITLDLRGALTPVVRQNRAGLINPVDVGELLRAIDGYRGVGTAPYALKLAPLTFVRPGELRCALWSEIDFKAADWRIPHERMKRPKPHIVPLSHQALALLSKLKPLTHGSRYVFPSVRTLDRPISNNTVTAALRRLGYSGEEMTGHGFRTTASTNLNEFGWDPELIELQLAHTDDNRVRAAYNHAQRLPERRQMMQAWADYLDRLRNGELASDAGRENDSNCSPDRVIQPSTLTVSAPEPAPFMGAAAANGSGV